ncbi:MAG: hypothetical protein ACI8Z1_002616 [Candidatus Azotimanducaceae bacterium]|jgi:hypothetical protein
MATKREYIELIGRLTELTQSEKLEWERNPAPESLDSPETKVDSVYEVEYKDRYLRLYEQRYKHFTDEFDFYWSDRAVLEIVDGGGGLLWKFPELRSTQQLLEAAQYREAGVDDFLRDVFEEGDE